MRQKSTLIALGVLILLLSAGLIYIMCSNTVSQSPVPVSPSPSQVITQAQDLPTTALTNPMITQQTTLTPRPTTPTSGANIKVFSPRANDKVGSRFTVTGEARVFENVFQTRVTNAATNEVLFDKHAMADAKDTGQYGPFSVIVDLASANLRSGDTLLLEVFQYSAKDGYEVDKVSIPLAY